MTNHQLKWGILGCAGIAIRAVVPGIQASTTGKVIAIASRDLTKAEQTAKQLHISRAYGSYQELLDDPEIEAVYIPLPNHLHKEWTLKAVQAGKHVLCEKPFALDAHEAQEMVDAANQAGVQVAEAFMYRHHPRYEKIREVIHAGEIGELRTIHSSFTFHGAIEQDNVRYHHDMGGGSIYDVGVYPISLARMIFNSEPEAATVHAFFSSQHDQVDMMASGLLEFPHHQALTFDCGMWAHFRNEAEILGTKGRILLSSAFMDEQDSKNNFILENNQGRREIEIPVVNTYTLQADDLAYAIWGQKQPKFHPRDAVKNMVVVDACLASARERKRIVIS